MRIDLLFFFFFSSRRRHTRWNCDWIQTCALPICLTVLTGETGTGKTMVVTGLHLLGGGRADATRVRSDADRAVVEGRFTTSELSAGVGTLVDKILESSGAERDDDGSIIAARSVSRDGPSRAHLGGRSVPAKSLST